MARTRKPRTDEQKKLDNQDISREIREVSDAWARVNNSNLAGFAKHLNLTTPALSRYRQGVRLPDPDLREEIAAIGAELGISTPYLGAYEHHEGKKARYKWDDNTYIPDAEIWDGAAFEIGLDSRFYTLIKDHFDIEREFQPINSILRKLYRENADFRYLLDELDKEDKLTDAGRKVFEKDPYYLQEPKGNAFWYAVRGKYYLLDDRDQYYIGSIYRTVLNVVDYMLYQKRKEDAAIVELLEAKAEESRKHKDIDNKYEDWDTLAFWTDIKEIIESLQFGNDKWEDHYRKMKHKEAEQEAGDDGKRKEDK